MKKSRKFGLNLENLTGLSHDDLYDKKGNKEQIVGSSAWKKKITIRKFDEEEDSEWEH